MIKIEEMEQKEWIRIQSFELRVGAYVVVKVHDRCLYGCFAGSTGMQVFLREYFALPGLPGAAPSYDFTGRVQAVFFDHIDYIEADDKDMRIWEP